MTVPTSQRTTVNSHEAKFFKTIGARLLEARKTQGLTQAQLAERLGVVQQTYGDYEMGALRFPASTLPVLAQALGLTLVELLGHDTKPTLKRGPVSRLDKQIERIRQLPRSRQHALMDMQDGFLAKTDH